MYTNNSFSFHLFGQVLSAFKLWRKYALEFVDTPQEGIAVKALCELKKGDVVIKMPKKRLG